MKKRRLGTILAVAACLSLAGCSEEGISSVPDLEQGPYTDGSYEVRMPQYENGWQEYGKITVTDGYITDVEYDAHNEAGEKKGRCGAPPPQRPRISVHLASILQPDTSIRHYSVYVKERKSV